MENKPGEIPVDSEWQTVTRTRKKSTASTHSVQVQDKLAKTGSALVKRQNGGTKSTRNLKANRQLPASPHRRSQDLKKTVLPGNRSAKSSLLKAATPIHLRNPTRPTLSILERITEDNTLLEEEIDHSEQHLDTLEHNFDDGNVSEDQINQDDDQVDFSEDDTPFLVLCPFPHPDPYTTTFKSNQSVANVSDDTWTFTKRQPLIDHLATQHALKFTNIHHMNFSLQAYLEYWSQMDNLDKINGVRMENTRRDGHIIPMRVIDPWLCKVDDQLRRTLQKEKLEEILAVQDRERHTEAMKPRKCLFCRDMSENRVDLFRHMYTVHNFNIGRPDNLVYVEEFLNLLQDKLYTQRQCLFCEKVFPSMEILRKHMRKKKHIKISPKNRRYDRYYVINYVEAGKSWEDFEEELAKGNDSEDDVECRGERASVKKQEQHDDGDFEDWSEPDQEPTPCLFCTHVSVSPEDALEHMKRTHGFDLNGLKKQHGKYNCRCVWDAKCVGWSFYQTVSLVNFIRQHTIHLRCFACVARVKGAEQAEEYETEEVLVEHMQQHGCFTRIPGPDHELWRDPQYLFPILENDPLLMVIDVGEEEGTESKEQKQQALRAIRSHIHAESVWAKQAK